MKKPTILTIAGFDPSGCAGILADSKTMEAHGVYGMAVCTANTVQNVNQFEKPCWIGPEEILDQLRFLQKERSFEFVKIGLIENFSVLKSVIDALISSCRDVKIIWDPVCKASAGFEFHTAVGKSQLEEICSSLFLITPNLDEMNILVPPEGSITIEKRIDKAGNYLAQFCNTLIKGGHSNEDTATDILYQGKEIHHFVAKKLFDFSKRGTGCVLSSAILANLANGNDLIQACEDAKKYVFNYLISTKTRIGEHVYERI
jgi:hydroxymethylpyrimidine/phosphomethylpyrimidine kinase